MLTGKMLVMDGLTMNTKRVVKFHPRIRTAVSAGNMQILWRERKPNGICQAACPIK